MALHFVNLAIRFCLEMTTLIAVGMWGWNNTEGWMRYVAAIGMPMALSVTWGVFNVPGDPSRGGSAPVAVPGIVRLVIEILFFAAGAWALMSLGYAKTEAAFIIVVIIHYLASYHRVMWILER